MNTGLVSGTIQWITHPLYSEETVGQWLAFVVIILIASFLWSTVVKQLS